MPFTKLEDNRIVYYKIDGWTDPPTLRDRFSYYVSTLARRAANSWLKALLMLILGILMFCVLNFRQINNTTYTKEVKPLAKTLTKSVKPVHHNQIPSSLKPLKVLKRSKQEKGQTANCQCRSN